MLYHLVPHIVIIFIVKCYLLIYYYNYTFFLLYTEKILISKYKECLPTHSPGVPGISVWSVSHAVHSVSVHSMQLATLRPLALA